MELNLIFETKSISKKVKRRLFKIYSLIIAFLKKTIITINVFLRRYIAIRRINHILGNLNNESLVKLNLGCGTDYKIGWINIDNNNDRNISKIDLKWDLRYKLPFEDNSVDLIFNEHFLEHLTIEEGLKALSDFKRVLKINGVLRIAMPDLKATIEEYLDPDWKQRAWLKKFGLDFVQTRAELININFRSWGHKHLYDQEELERRLIEVGYREIRFCELRQSNILELANLETRNESILIAEAVK